MISGCLRFDSAYTIVCYQLRAESVVQKSEISMMTDVRLSLRVPHSFRHDNDNDDDDDILMLILSYYLREFTRRLEG